jgi:RNA polymerase sigma-70 factor (ECF subfamily)
MDELQPAPQETTQAAGRATQPNESELVAQLLRKDRKTTAVFVTLYSDQVYGYVQRRLIPHTDHVDDLVQEIFLAAWENLGKFRGESSLQNWILGIARHKVENHYRNRLREVQLSPEEEDLEPDPVDLRNLGEAFDVREQKKLVREVLEKISEPYTVVLLWRYWEKRSLREIAVATGKTEKAIERLLARARDQFKKKWNERHVLTR